MARKRMTIEEKVARAEARRISRMARSAIRILERRDERRGCPFEARILASEIYRRNFFAFRGAVQDLLSAGEDPTTIPAKVARMYEEGLLKNN